MSSFKDFHTDDTIAKLERRAKFATWFSSAIAEVCTRKQLGKWFDSSESLVNQWCSPSSKNLFSVADALILPDEIRIQVAQLIAGEGYTVAQLPVLDDSIPEHRLCLDLHREAVGTVTELLESTHDGVLTRNEGAKLYASANRAQRVLESVKVLAKAAVDGGDRILRRVG